MNKVNGTNVYTTGDNGDVFINYEINFLGNTPPEWLVRKAAYLLQELREDLDEVREQDEAGMTQLPPCCPRDNDGDGNCDLHSGSVRDRVPVLRNPK